MEFTDLPLDRNCQVVSYHEAGIWVIEKATGVLSHPNHGNLKAGQKSLLRADYCHKKEAYHWQNENGKQQWLYLCHRLDSPTSGIIIGCTNNELASIVKKTFLDKKIKKTYFAITGVNPRIRMGTWKDSLVERKINGKLRVQPGKGSLAITKAGKMRERNGKVNFQLLELLPLTGKTHQLRVQCMIRKVPILGDKTYGDFSLNRKFQQATRIQRLCLHASQIEFNIEYEREEIKIFAESPLPRQMGKIFG